MVREKSLKHLKQLNKRFLLCVTFSEDKEKKIINKIKYIYFNNLHLQVLSVDLCVDQH